MVTENQAREGFKRLLELLSQEMISNGRSAEAEDTRLVARAISTNSIAASQIEPLFTKYHMRYSDDPMSLVDLATTIAGCESDNSPVDETRPMPSSVTGIQLCGGLNIKVIGGTEHRVRVVARNATVAKQIITEVSGNTLIIKPEKNSIIMQTGNGNVTQVITGFNNIVAGGDIITSGNSLRFSLGGLFSRTSISHSTSEEYVEVTLPLVKSIDVQGSGRVDVNDIKQSDLNIAIQGSGVIYLSGTIETITGLVQGSGSIHAKNALINHGKLNVQGSGSIKANILKSVRATVSGSGEIKVYGAPSDRSETVLGSGKIKFK